MPTNHTQQNDTETNERLGLVLKSAGVGIWDWDLSADEGWESKELGPIFGREEGFQHGRLEEWLADVHPEDRNRAKKDLQDAISGERYYDSTYRVLWPDGKTVRWLNAQAKIIRDEQDRPVKLLGWVLDVTERKEAERLRALLAAVVESADDAILSKDLESVITSWNKSAQRIFGYTPAEVIGRPVTILIPPERVEEELGIINQIKNGRRVESFDTERLRKDGTRIQVSVTVSPVKDASGKVIGASTSMRDISRRKAAESALSRSEERLRAVISTAVDGIITIDERGIMLSVNPASERLFGYTAEEMLGKNVSLLMPEPDKSAHDQYLKNYLQTGRRKIIGIGREVQGQRKDGSIFPMELAVGESHVGGEHFFTGMVKDISARKSAEDSLRQARDELATINQTLEKKVRERTAKLQESLNDLEHFSYTISHDMRAPLRAMQGYARLFLEDGEGLDRTQVDYLKRIITAAQRLDELIQDALSFSQAVRQELSLHPVDPAELLRGILESYPAFQMPHAVVRLEGSFPLVLGNQAGMTQCLSNLLSNAVKFVPPERVPEVRIWAEEKGEYVRIWVEDNGIGVPEEHHERIFAMFHRVSNHYRGTGIGLALVRKVVERMRGRVGLESAPGKGSRFWIELKHFDQLQS